MRIRHGKISVGVFLILASLLSACQPIGDMSAAESVGMPKVAFVYVGPVGDLVGPMRTIRDG